MKSSMLKYKWMCLVLACCALFVACEPASTTSTQNPISFGAGRKNSAYNPDLNDGINATLWGYNGANAIFNGVDAKLYETTNNETTNNETTKWDIDIKSETKYWNIGTYNFFSVSPKLDAPATATNAGLTITDFDISSQTDIIAAATTGISVTKLEHNTPVTLNYKHLLTKIKFRAHTTVNSCIITEFKIKVPHKATYAYIYTYNNDGTKVWNSSWKDQTDFVWLEFKTAVSVGETDCFIDIDGDADGATIDGWLVYPATITTDAIAYSITYKVGDKELPPQTGYLPDLDEGGLAGESYIYTFEITPSGPITFSPVSITGWGREDESIYGDLNFKN